LRDIINRLLTAATTAAIALLPAFAAAVAPAADPTGPTDHDIEKAAVVDRVILAVMENSYAPGRVDTRAMFEAAMDAVQSSVAEVKVRHDDAGGSMTLEIMDTRLTIGLDRVRSPWGLSKALKRVFGFLKKELPPGDRDYLALEYAAVNGLLSVLDPHTLAMMPDQWAELRMAIQGVFEGIGIRITTDRRPPCGGDLTVVEVFEDTPAKLAGLRRGDKILRNDGESTVNITTSEAADRLRGSPGTQVTVEVKRTDGGRKEIVIPRGKIPIESVRWELLDGDVGYVALESFSDNSGAELAGALAAMHKRGMKGLVLDLRGNPGGSLGVAIEIANLFLDSGTIVTTAGRTEEEREVENATSKGTEPAYPMVVLINTGSASAAEILAGAVRNHGRAMLVGDTTFGKGSVQRILPLPAGGALRITTAQYLTPGDISIQAVGVAPDLRFTPIVVDREDLNLDSSRPVFSEADLDAHLSRPNALERTDRRSAIESEVFVPPAQLKADMKMFEQCYAEDPDRELYLSRYQKEFSRRLVASTDGVTTTELVVAAEDLIAKDAVRSDAEIGAALRKMGVDWSPAPAKGGGSPREDAAVKATARVRGKAEPGRKLELTARVTNGGSDTIYRLRAVTASDNPLLAGRELAFGKLAPGQSRSWTAVMEIPRVYSARIDPVTLQFSAQRGPVPAPVSVDVEIPDRPTTKIAYAWHLEDLGNGNGYVEAGEDLRMVVELTNIGDRPTYDLDVDLSAKPGVDIRKGHFEVEPVPVGRTVRGQFDLKVADDFPLDEARLRLMVGEWVPAKPPVSLDLLSREIALPVSAAMPRSASASGTVTVATKGEASLLASPDAASRVTARAEPGASFRVDGRSKGFFRVVLEDGMHAWIAEPATRPGGDGKGRCSLASIRPPRIHIDGKKALDTAGESYRLAGWASHDDGERDVIVFVGDRKVAYLPNRDAASPGRMEFALDVPLADGANQVTVVARHDDEIADTGWVFVRRRVP